MALTRVVPSTSAGGTRPSAEHDTMTVEIISNVTRRRGRETYAIREPVPSAAAIHGNTG
ncbi:hypothetical protein AGR9A_Cc80077 [Agrobacterium salinitolerans str. Hayward 0363]|nr:hypothetical protein AGR9A_Cc80077 [Agrobacterium salinitolerans str. Hayward 0363]